MESSAKHLRDTTLVACGTDLPVVRHGLAQFFERQRQLLPLLHELYQAGALLVEQNFKALGLPHALEVDKVFLALGNLRFRADDFFFELGVALLHLPDPNRIHAFGPGARIGRLR